MSEQVNSLAKTKLKFYLVGMRVNLISVFVCSFVFIINENWIGLVLLLKKQKKNN